jgi:hypothetical protein
MTKVKANSGSRRARRGWSVAEKQRIVDEISVAGATVSGVARRGDVAADKGACGRAAFTPVVIVPASHDADTSMASGRLEIVLAGGARLIVSGGVPSTILADAILAIMSA